MRLSVLASILSLVGAGQAFFGRPKPILNPAIRKLGLLRKDGGSVETGTFDQLIDHSRPELGTFKQNYYYHTLYYKGPGSPISLASPSEEGFPEEYADTSNASMPGFIAQQIGGAYVAIEHRYYGSSAPIPNDQYDTETLQPLTLENSVDDLVYFARNVKLPFDPEGLSHPDKAPWMLSGCSYSGALSAWTQAMAPGTFWAYEAGSAVVQARNDLWQYYVPVEKAMPRNCSADWNRIMGHINDVLVHGSDADKRQLKSKMGEPDMGDIRFGEFVSRWLDNWQGTQYFSYGQDGFFSTCDYIENQVPRKDPMPGPEGVGLEKALDGFIQYLHQGEAHSRDGKDDQGPDPWDWQCCNEPQVPSALETVKYEVDSICHAEFPPADKYTVGIDRGLNETTVNRLTGGWVGAANLTRIAWVNADEDPWLFATVSSPDRPGGPLQGREDAPVYMLHGTAHCNDYVLANYGLNDDATKMFDGVAANMKKWADEFYHVHTITRPE